MVNEYASVTLRDVTFQYDGKNIERKESRKPAIDEFSHEWSTSGITALLGPNGSGKSTLLKLIAGIIQPQKGKITLSGNDLSRLTPKQRAQEVAYVSSDLPVSFPLSVQEAVLMGRFVHQPQAGWSSRLGVPTEGDLKATEVAMERCGCLYLKQRMISELSAGERQLTLLARALAQNPRVYLFDETFSQMDLNHQFRAGKLLWELRQEGKLIFFVSHDLDFLTEWSEEVLVLKAGQKQASGKAEDVICEALFESLYEGIRIGIGENPFSGKKKIFRRL